MTPIASVTLANGNRVEFYEPNPGALLVSEAGAVGAAPTSRAGRNSVELYRDLAPGQPVPEALIAAEARAEVQHPTAGAGSRGVIIPPSNVAAPGPGPGFIANQSCDDEWFNSTFCTIGSPDWQMCLLDHLGGAFAQLSSVDGVRHDVCADIGGLTLRVQMGNGAGGIWTVDEGSWRTYWWQDNCAFGCNTSTRGDVLDASTSRFHYSVRAWF